MKGSGSSSGRTGSRFWRFFQTNFFQEKLKARSQEYLKTFCVETCWAEFVHWLTMGWAPLFWLWNEWWVELIIIAYALAVSLPCIIVQPYNLVCLARLSKIHKRKHSP